jgi:hypothetical protein
MTMSDWHPVPLSFEVSAYVPGPDGSRTLTITSVLRDDHAIRVNYEIVPHLVNPEFGPWGDAEDDLGNQYEDSGGAYGFDDRRNRTNGTLSCPRPDPSANLLTVRIEWVYGDTWAGGEHELRVDLANAP